MSGGPCLPLRAVPRAELTVGDRRVIEDCKGNEIAHVRDDHDAELMVVATNLHSELVDMLERVYDAEFAVGGWPDQEDIRALLIKAGKAYPA